MSSQAVYALDGSQTSPVHDPQLNPELSVFILSSLPGSTRYSATPHGNSPSRAGSDSRPARISTTREPTPAFPPCCRLVHDHDSAQMPVGLKEAGLSNPERVHTSQSVPAIFSHPMSLALFARRLGLSTRGPNPPGPGIPTSVRADTLINSGSCRDQVRLARSPAAIRCRRLLDRLATYPDHLDCATAGGCRLRGQRRLRPPCAGFRGGHDTAHRFQTSVWA